MAVKIRLKRMGAKKRPFYRIVVADSRAPRDGRFIEEIGYYNPLTDPKVIKVNKDKVDQWIKNGAKPTDTVNRLLKQAEALVDKKDEKEPVQEEKEIEEPETKEEVEEPQEEEKVEVEEQEETDEVVEE